MQGRENQKDVTMGNQQERFEIDLAWLTGLIEGEGWVSILYYKSNQKNNTYTPALKASIGVVNCDFLIMNKIMSILTNLDIKFRKNLRKAAIGSDGISRKEKLEIYIDNQHSLKKLANVILPFIIGEKKFRVEKVIQFLQIRQLKGRSGKNSKYGKEEFLLYKEMYSYKGKSRSKILNDLTLDEIIKNFEDKV